MINWQTSREDWENAASENITDRNELVKDGLDPNGYLVNYYEEEAAICLSISKKERAWKGSS